MAQVIEWLGVDVGWVHPAADSEGNVYEWTRRRRPTDPMTEAGPVTIRRVDGTTSTRPPYSPETAAMALARGDRNACRFVAMRIISTAKRQGRGLALEDWSAFERRKRAWVVMYAEIEMNAIARDVSIVQVDRAFTSITCPDCGLKDRGNRPIRGRFHCINPSCGREGHADVIAAINIAAKASGTFGLNGPICEADGCENPVWAAARCGPCYHFARAHGRLPTPGEIDARKDARAFRTARQKTVLEERRASRDAVTRARWEATWRTPKAAES